MTPTNDKMTPTNDKTNVKTLPIQDSVFDLQAFDDVTLYKEFQHVPVATVQEAQERLGNDSARLLKVINDGLESEARRIERQNPEGWQVLDDEGKPSGPFTGIRADGKKVNALKLTLAKSIFGFSKDMTADQRKAAKDQAVAFIKGNEQIRKGLQVSAAITNGSDEDAIVAPPASTGTSTSTSTSTVSE